MTAIGSDRPGLVDELTGALHGRQVNIADSRMVNLHGHFAIILLLELPDSSAKAIREELPAMGERIGLTVTVGPQGDAGTEIGSGVPYRLRTYAMDQPGIVHRLTHHLHGQDINIEELETRLEPGSVTGTPLFTMDLRMTVPTQVQIAELRRDLEKLCNSFNCDFDMEPA